jgi:virginiamycin A acetyltransferase
VVSRARESLVRFIAGRVLGMVGNSGTSVGFVARRWALGRLLRRCGRGVHVGPGIEVIGAQAVEVGDRFRTMRGAMLYASGDGAIVIGDNCSINTYVQIDAGPQGAIRVGDDVLIGPNVAIRNCDHRWRDGDRLIREQGHSCADIDVGNNVWIAANTVILGGVKLEEGCVVAAGSVVRRGAYGPDALLAGNPAEVIGGRIAPGSGDGAEPLRPGRVAEGTQR